MSLWTPDGEHEVPREPQGPTPEGPADQQASAGIPDAPSLDDLSPEERAEAEAMIAEMSESRARIADTPAAVVVANHAMGLYELGAIHLSNDPPNLPEAKLAIDAFGAVLDAVPGRLGEHEETLQAARSQIQMAFVELSSGAGQAS